MGRVHVLTDSSSHLEGVRQDASATSNRATAYLPTLMRADNNRVWRLYAAVGGKGVRYSLGCTMISKMTTTLFKYVGNNDQLINCT
jgi:hypothetical protein